MIRLPPYKPATQRTVWDFTVPLLGQLIRYRLLWRPRAQSWYLDLWTGSTRLITNKRISEAAPLLWRHRHGDVLPAGRLVLFSIAQDHSEPDRDGLGWTHMLYWVEPSDQTEPQSLVVSVS